MGPVRRDSILEVQRMETLSAKKIKGAVYEDAEQLVRVQWVDYKESLVELSMSFLDAMFLLNMLKGIQKDTGFQMPE